MSSFPQPRSGFLFPRRLPSLFLNGCLRSRSGLCRRVVQQRTTSSSAPLPPTPNAQSKTTTVVENPIASMTMTTPWLNTYQLVLYLEQHGFSRPQAVAYTSSLSQLLHHHLRSVRNDLVTSHEADQETYTYRIALHELKTELSTLRKTETSALQSATASIQRDLDILSLKFREDFNTVKSDIQLEMNTRKSELGETQQKSEYQLQEINHRLSLLMGEVKTELEAMKLQLITKWASGIALGSTAFIIFVLKWMI